MARIPYAKESSDPVLAARIREQRGGKMLNLYRMLMNSPPVADGWLHLLTAIRQQTEVPADIRELAILRVAVINGAQYEFQVHVPFAMREGVSAAQIEALRQSPVPAVFDARQQAALAYTDEMTRNVHVEDAVFDALRPYFTERQLVELTATIASYNLVSRFLEALGVDPEPEQAGR